MNVVPGPGLSGGNGNRPTPSDLRAMWRTATLERGWSYPDDWWVPAIDAITEAIHEDDDVAPGCRRLGAARAVAGVSMKETLDDIFALGQLLQALLSHPSTGPGRGGFDPLTAVRATAEGWADGSEGPGAGAALDDPLSWLADAAYLSIRLGEIYQGAEAFGHRASATHAFVVVSLVGPARAVEDDEPFKQLVASSDRWEQMRQASSLAQDVQRVFSRGETVALAGPGTVVVLAPRTPALPGQVATLRQLIEAGTLSLADPGRRAVGVWVEGLPETLRNARQLLQELRR